MFVAGVNGEGDNRPGQLGSLDHELKECGSRGLYELGSGGVACGFGSAYITLG